MRDEEKSVGGENRREGLYRMKEGNGSRNNV